MLFILALELHHVSISQNEFEGSTGCVSNMSHKTHYFAPHWETWTPHSSHNSKVIYVSIQRHPNAVQFLWVVVNTNSVCADSMKGGLGRPLQTKNLGNWKCFKKQDHREERKGKKNTWQTTGKWEKSEERTSCVNNFGGFVSHRAAGAESGWSTGECWPR